MKSFKFSLYVHPFEQQIRHFDLLFSLTKSFRPSKRISKDWNFIKVLDEYVYIYSQFGFTFKMVCKLVSGHLYFSRFTVNMYNEITGCAYDEDMIRDYSLYIYEVNTSHKIRIVSFDKNMPEMVYNSTKLV